MLPAPETWTAPDGTRVTLRPITADDFQLEREFVDGLSPATGHQRLMSTRRLTADEIRRFTDIDYAHEMALIATIGEAGRERQVGVARYVEDQSVPREAEFAIVLADDWQGRGLGAKLLGNLIDIAKKRGLRRLIGTALSSNQGMLALARKMGFGLRFHPESATQTVMALEL